MCFHLPLPVYPLSLTLSNSESTCDTLYLENAIAKLTSIGKILLHGDNPYSWLLAKLCVEIAVIYTRTSMRYNLTTLFDKMTDTGKTALERYLRQCYRSNKALAWHSQVRGIEKLTSDNSFGGPAARLGRRE